MIHAIQVGLVTVAASLYSIRIGCNICIYDESRFYRNMLVKLIVFFYLKPVVTFFRFRPFDKVYIGLIDYYYMALASGRYNARSDWPVVTEL